MKYLSIILFLCLAFFLYYDLATPFKPHENTPITIPENGAIKHLDTSRGSTYLDFSKPFTKSVPYISYDDYKPINEDIYSKKTKYANDDTSCTFWLNKYEENNNGYNKVHRDKACNGFIITNAIRR